MIRPFTNKLAGGGGASATTIAMRDESARNPRIAGDAIEPRSGGETSCERPIVPATRHIRVAGLSGGSSRTRHPRLLLFWHYAPPHGCKRSYRPDGVTRAKTQRLEGSARSLPLCSAISESRHILRGIFRLVLVLVLDVCSFDYEDEDENENDLVAAPPRYVFASSCETRSATLA